MFSFLKGTFVEYPTQAAIGEAFETITLAPSEDDANFIVDNDDIILTDENYAVFNQFKNQGEIPNLLFAGAPGIGKTSLAKIIVNSLIECDYLYINASDENDIESIRAKCVPYAKQRPTKGKINVIILDECDGLLQESQRALRNIIEEYSRSTRWVLTCNYIHRIILAT